jgi:hypothetical protein|nr:MAG TPA: holin [Caudoviricetes sp.]
MKEGWSIDRAMAAVRLACQLAATIAAGFGLALDADSLATVALCVVAAATGVWSWWKNNNVTKAAQDAQRVLDGIKGKGTR